MTIRTRSLFLRPTLLSLAAGSALVLSGCFGKDEAPADIDGLAHFLLQHWQPNEADRSVSDGELQDALTRLGKALDIDSLEEPLLGTLSDLTQADLDAVGTPDKDPSRPQGMFVASVFHCTLPVVDALNVRPDQATLYPELFETYTRTFDADADPAQPTWVANYKSAEDPFLGTQFTSVTHSGLRRIPDLGAELSPHGPALAARVVLPEPVVFTYDGPEFTDDNQLEAFFERAPGEIVHFYAMWRYMRLGVLGDSRDDVLIDTTLNGLVDYEKKTEELCADPPPEG